MLAGYKVDRVTCGQTSGVGKFGFCIQGTTDYPTQLKSDEAAVGTGTMAVDAGGFHDIGAEAGADWSRDIDGGAAASGSRAQSLTASRSIARRLLAAP